MLSHAAKPLALANPGTQLFFAQICALEAFSSLADLPFHPVPLIQ